MSRKKYLVIYHDLVDKIQTNVWPKNSLLPSEHDLSEMYQTSRETIRKALNLLAQNGYIQKVQGKGSVVIDFDTFSFPVSGIVSYKELVEELGLSSKTIVSQLGYTEAMDIRYKLDVSAKDKVWGVTRVREISSEKVIIDKDFFNEKYVPLLSKETCEDSIYHYIEKELGLTISYAQKEIVVENPTEGDRELLDLEGFSNVVVIRSLVYLDDSSLFQYTESRHRPDKFRFVEFARRVRR
ncbi:trehalose operon repressor [Oceanobacillus caeni]|uniref:Trehalose operon repressor n=1 Tax=Oceanobacillus caeni TaxID=405946 RepID=A0ABR5MJI1_9BACI|nr:MULTISPECIES: trehalose operon repressor [Bacillaceae]KKE78255.1 trehalose operon transcriptional repressor [Bacilli bacterium VT-13-104]PZD83106.1 trehalose operon repressor [Bacilli bacterium]KPH75657.1 trehalose operon transcriptional repressor [Oceanobacillus caeni]MBU8792323.1 trehalose operon repressor [Oceanobacillus caeni]MCR1835679.1 trehalose operon repressor [Oceanobacillus caeni]